ncbi:MAG TPA: L-fucokinase, partial [Abditibacteriaceae bacterium]
MKDGRKTALPKSFDVVVLTAANEAQAQGYRAQLASREKRGLLPPGSSWCVVADPGGRRVGSGASTIEVLLHLASHICDKGDSFAERFRGKRILIAHSGGDARRIPAYAALGKIFMPMPCAVNLPHRADWEQYPATLFDLMLQSLSGLESSPEGEVIICSGDVLLTFDASDTNLHTPAGVTGLGFAAPLNLGRQHGVYITRHAGIGGQVTDFLQKPSAEEMNESGAVDATGRILVDTGVLNFSPEAVEALLDASGIELHNGDVRVGPGLHDDVLNARIGIIDLYQEIALALPAPMTAEKYLSHPAIAKQSSEARAKFRAFFEKLHAHAVPFNVTAVPDGEFFHVGNTRDLLTRFLEPSRTARRFRFQNGFLVEETGAAKITGAGKPTDVSHLSGLTVFNSTGEFGQLSVAGAAYLEGCTLGTSDAGKLQLQGENVLVGAELHALGTDSLPRGLGLATLPLAGEATGEDITIVFGVDDDNKTTHESGKARWLGHSLEAWIE